jgi:RNA polymerase sigma-70 factor, ECF subfamily
MGARGLAYSEVSDLMGPWELEAHGKVRWYAKDKQVISPTHENHAAPWRGVLQVQPMEPSVRLYKSNAAGGPRRRAARSGTVPKSAPSRRAATSAQVPVQSADTPEPVEVLELELQSELQSQTGPVVGVSDFEDIFTRFQTPLCNFVFRLVGNREQAYDLTQDVFVKAYRALSSGTTIQAGALSSWLYRIASNTATDALRRRRLIAWLPLSLFNEDRGVGAGLPGGMEGSGSQSGSGDDSFPGTASVFAGGGYDGARFEQRVADREIVQSVLDRLPPKYAVCLLLYEHEGFSCAEIAEVLKVSPSAVKMRLMRARERFITLYKQEVSGD